MNEILNQLLEQQTPEQVQQAFDKIRQKRGYCPNDISVEEALGIDIDLNINFQCASIKISLVSSSIVYQETVGSLNVVKFEKSENINVSLILLTNVVSTFNKVANNTIYSVAA